MHGVLPFLVVTHEEEGIHKHIVPSQHRKLSYGMDNRTQRFRHSIIPKNQLCGSCQNHVLVGPYPIKLSFFVLPLLVRVLNFLQWFKRTPAQKFCSTGTRLFGPY